MERLVSIIGTEELSEISRRYLEFGERFEGAFVAQAFSENRDLERTLALGWEVLAPLPDDELTRMSRELIDRYRARADGGAAPGRVSTEAP